jgi:phosphoglycolate phosphatase
MIKLVLIDFDDTLCLTEEACFNFENSIAEKMGFAPMTRTTHLENWGKPLEEAIIERIPGINVKIFMKWVEKTLPEFINNGEFDVITDINLQTLDTLKERGIKIAIVTSRSLKEAKHLLDETYPLTSRIDAFYHRDNNDYQKPNPKVFDKPLRKFGVQPDEAVYVGDSISDAKSAKGAGLHFIALLESNLRTKEDFNSVSVDYFALQFKEILDYIEENK